MKHPIDRSTYLQVYNKKLMKELEAARRKQLRMSKKPGARHLARIP